MGARHAKDGSECAAGRSVLVGQNLKSPGALYWVGLVWKSPTLELDKLVREPV